MEDPLYNPVYNALSSRDARFNVGNDRVKFFDERVSPFAGFNEENKNGFEELHELLPMGRRILYAIPQPIETPKGWKLHAEIKGSQFIWKGNAEEIQSFTTPVALEKTNTEEMVKLAALTKPGPFDIRTIEFGHYFGIFQNGQLAAMTGQRLHLPGLTEISAVCTHPDHLGKGYAGQLLYHQIDLILESGEVPFLHVRSDNKRAIDLYERIGFVFSRPMHFYFMRRE